MQFSEERKWQRNGVTNWKLELFEYLRSSPSFYFLLFINSKILEEKKRGKPKVLSPGRVQ